jgi:phosphoglucosamine mutase
MLEAALIAGCCAAGADVYPVGVLPTAGVAYLTRTGDVDLGVVISASHNPFADNGLKCFAHTGMKLPDALEAEIEAKLQATALDHPSGAGVGMPLSVAGMVDQYLASLRTLAPQGLAGMTLVVDCAHGAASPYAPALLTDLGATVIPRHAAPDGLNINAECGATAPAAMAQAVVQHGADAGLAFDGDADRLIMADAQGQLVDGDRLLAIAALHRQACGQLPGDCVVGTVMSNLGLERGLAARGIRLVRTPVGDRYVLEAMQQHGAVLGGEASGHLIFLDHATTGDGLVTALQTLAILRETGQPLAALASCYTAYPQRLVNVRVPSTAGWEAHPTITKALADAEGALGASGRVLVRASGTEPLIRVMVEADEARVVDDWVVHLAAVIHDTLGTPGVHEAVP